VDATFSTAAAVASTVTVFVPWTTVAVPALMAGGTIHAASKMLNDHRWDSRMER
jgi:hypothetical protein